jgi:GNAT superfamily N-acetyltransferase
MIRRSAKPLPSRWVWTTPGYEAATVWVPPGRPELNETDEALLKPMLEESLGARAGLVFDVFDRFEAAHPHAPDHYYLSLLGTHTAHRGAGIGMRLLADNLARLDAIGMPAYLESTNPANLRRYEGVGFAVCGAFDLPHGGPTVTTMWRDPSP